MSLVFIDCEMTDVFNNPELISIALVFNTYTFIYVELSDGWVEGDCSTFTLDYVLPYLGDSRLRVSRMSAVDQILNFLKCNHDQYGENITIVSDSDYIDMQMLKNLLKDKWPDHLNKVSIVCDQVERDVLDEAHNALTDAQQLHANYKKTATSN